MTRMLVMTNAAIVRVPFQGDTLDAIRDESRLWVSVRRVCESLGVDFSSQLAKLKERPWATMGFITTVAEDGKERALSCIDLDGLPMWLATIESSRVAEEVRPKLEIYQRQAASVLRDHFFGPREPACVTQATGVRAEFRPVGPGTGAVIDVETGRAVGPLPEDPTPTPRRFEVIGRFVDAMRFAVDAQDIQAAVIANGAIWRLTRLVGAPKALDAQKDDLEHEAASRILAYIRSETAAGRAVHGAEKAVREVRINKLRGARAVRSLLAAGLIENRPFGRLPRFWAVADASGPKAGELQ